MLLYEDPSVLAVIKPARMHSAPGLGGGDLCAWVFERYPDAALAGAGSVRRQPAGRPAAEGGLLHRLDYETSGIVLFARTAAAFADLLGQQERGAFLKEYTAFSHVAALASPAGSAPPEGFPAGVVEGAWADARSRGDVASLAAQLGAAREGGACSVSCAFRPFGPKGARVACLRPAAAPAGKAGAAYSSEILAAAADAAATAVALRVGLSRGFRHQIRAQLAWIGLPISGDSIYGGAPDDRLRLFAVGLAFVHPSTGEPTSLSAENPENPRSPVSQVAFKGGLR